MLIVLGTPSTVATISGEVFYYISQRTEQTSFLPQEEVNRRIIAIYFDKGRKVQRIADYGMRDGKVFDSVSRTTPSGGEELSYIRYMMRAVRSTDAAIARYRRRQKKPRGMPRGFLLRSCSCRSVREDRQQQQRHDVGDLDHRIDGGARRVLVGIADGVAGHRRLVGVGALAAVVAVFDVLLGVVPRAAARGHRDRDEQARHDHAEQHRADCRERGRLACQRRRPQ